MQLQHAGRARDLGFHVSSVSNRWCIEQPSTYMWACSQAVKMLHGALICYPKRYLPAVLQPDEKWRACTQGITLDVTLRCRPATLIRSRTRCG